MNSSHRGIDPFGNVVKEEFPNNLHVETTYDAFDRPLSVELAGHGSIEYTYNPLYLTQVQCSAL